MRWTLVFLAVLATANPAAGEDTLTLYIDDPVIGLMRYGSVTTGVPFDIVAVMHTERQSVTVEFVMTELIVEYPGVFKLSTTTLNHTGWPWGDQSKGEYSYPFASCFEPGDYEAVRVQYADFSGVLPHDVVLRPRGFQEGDSIGSSFDGNMGFIDCAEASHFLTGGEWPGHPCGYDSSFGDTDGICVVNLQCVSASGQSFSALKTRY